MEEDLRQYLEGMESRIGSRLDRVDGRLDQMDQRLDQVVEDFRDIETKLLREFHDWAAGVHNRTVRLETSDATFAARLAALENRVLRIETQREGQ